MYKRPQYNELFKRLHEPRRFIQVLSGPRQTGKTTLITQVLQDIKIPSHFAAADAVTAPSLDWIEQQWEIARISCKSSKKPVLLVLDEIQKIKNWTEMVKKLWDDDTRQRLEIRVVLLGSSPLLITQGLYESLTGRFELLRVFHWSYAEMKQAFNLTPDEYIYFGGYPGSIPLIKEPARWKQYIIESLIETSISKDVLLMNRIDKPALMRQLFELGCLYSSQVLSFNKVVGLLQDAGNTTTLAHYLHLLGSAGLLAGIYKFSTKKVVERSSSPKFQVLNNGLLTAQLPQSFSECRANPSLWGRIVESAIGAHLFQLSLLNNLELFYWRQDNKEVDFIIRRGDQLLAIEVKSGEKKESLPGLAEFAQKNPKTRKLQIGPQGLPLDQFLLLGVDALF